VSRHPAVAAGPCELLPWDSEHFGIGVARVLAQRLDDADLERAITWAAANDVACLYLLADADDAATWRLAASRGFRFVDLRMTMGRRLTDVQRGPGSGKVTVRPAQPDDEPKLLEMARAGHVDSRFYADGRFDPSAVAALYERWMRRSLEGALAELVVVADIGGEAAGYVTILFDPDGGVGTIELLGVSARRRGTGIGTALVAAALERFRNAGLTAARVVTQGRNVPGQRLYQASGFRTELVELWYHRWSDEHDHGRPAQ
jgi:ribosomal protein S18 acetylase RimI-like enzyme